MLCISKCLRQTATHPCGRGHRLISKILEKVSPRGLKSTKLGLKLHQVRLQNPPSWAPKSRKISLERTLEGSWGHPGPSWPPRSAQDHNIPPKPISGTSWAPVWEPKSSQNRFFKVPRGIHFLVNFLIDTRWIFLGFRLQLGTQNQPKIGPSCSHVTLKFH